MPRVFISYAHQDSAFADRLCADLQAAGIEVFYDKQLEPGASWAEVLESSLRACDFVLSVLSPAGVASQWVRQEWLLALDEELRSDPPRTKLIPLKIADFIPPEDLSRKRWIDFSQDYQQALAQLVTAIQRPATPKTISAGDLKSNLQRIAPQVEAFRQTFSGTGDGTAAGPPSIKGTGGGGMKLGFMVMPFNQPSLESAYRDYIVPIAKELGLEMKRGDDAVGSNAIIDDIRKSIDEADLIIADLTGKNPNVFYEVGVCHTLNKNVLLITQSKDDIPFDVRHLRVLMYQDSLSGAKLLETNLRVHLKDMLASKAGAAKA